MKKSIFYIALLGSLFALGTTSCGDNENVSVEHVLTQEELDEMEFQEVVIIEKQNMLVLIVENSKDPELKRIPNRLNTLRRIVGNENIEVIKYKDVLIVYNAR